MKLYEITEPKGIDSLKLTERPTPKPGPGEVLVRVRATSLNYRDLALIKGGLARMMKLPLIPLSDGAGDVVESGPGVRTLKKGDRVAAIFTQGWLAGPPFAGMYSTALGGGIDGMLAEYVVLREEGFVRIPDYMSYEEAASLPCAAVTSWNALVAEGHIKPGDSVLVMGTGGVSIFALQFAKMYGARVIATSSSDAKLKRLKELGASGVINYKTTPEWDEAVLELTDGLGVDHVVEIGGAGTLAQIHQRGQNRRGGQPDRDSGRRGADRSDAAALQECADPGDHGRLARDVRGDESRADRQSGPSGDRSSLSVRSGTRGLPPSRKRRAFRQGLHRGLSRVSTTTKAARPRWATGKPASCSTPRPPIRSRASAIGRYWRPCSITVSGARNSAGYGLRTCKAVRA